MGKNPRRRFRRPVLSRLTLAWTAFAAASAALVSYAYFATSANDFRIALAVDGEVRRIAGPALAAAAPGPRAEDRFEFQPTGGQTFALSEDAFGGPDVPYTDGILNIEPEEVIITIDGAPARSTRGPDGVKLAAVTRRPAIVPASPDPALLQKTPLGMIPKIDADGRRASKIYARPDSAPQGAARVAVVVGGLGLNAELTARAIDELPPEVTLAFAPYAKNLDHWTAKARAAGHETMIELPMDAHGASAQALGPAALLADRSPAENQQRLDWLLSRFSGYFAATNYLGSKFSADRAALAALIERLDALGVAYIDDTGLAGTVKGGRTVGVVDRMILSGDIREAQSGLKALHDSAARSGAALGKIYVSDAAIDALRDWSRDLQSGPVALAPVSALLQAQGGRG